MDKKPYGGLNPGSSEAVRAHRGPKDYRDFCWWKVDTHTFHLLEGCLESSTYIDIQGWSWMWCFGDENGKGKLIPNHCLTQIRKRSSCQRIKGSSLDSWKEGERGRGSCLPWAPTLCWSLSHDPRHALYALILVRTLSGRKIISILQMQKLMLGENRWVCPR